jgi:hypothetical protein
VFERNTSNFSNIKLHDEFDIVSCPIDLCITGDYDFFGINNTIERFEKNIVSGGYLIATLYNKEKHPDIVTEIDKFINSGWTNIFCQDTFIIIQKP